MTIIFIHKASFDFFQNFMDEHFYCAEMNVMKFTVRLPFGVKLIMVTIKVIASVCITIGGSIIPTAIGSLRI